MATFREILEAVKKDGEANNADYFAKSNSHLLRDKLTKRANGQYLEEIRAFVTAVDKRYLETLRETEHFEKDQAIIIKNLHEKSELTEKLATETVRYMMSFIGRHPSFPDYTGDSSSDDSRPAKTVAIKSEPKPEVKSNLESKPAIKPEAAAARVGSESSSDGYLEVSERLDDAISLFGRDIDAFNAKLEKQETERKDSLKRLERIDQVPVKSDIDSKFADLDERIAKINAANEELKAELEAHNAEIVEKITANTDAIQDNAEKQATALASLKVEIEQEQAAQSENNEKLALEIKALQEDLTRSKTEATELAEKLNDTISTINGLLARIEELEARPVTVSGNNAAGNKADVVNPDGKKILAVFNRWAANPSDKLPAELYYIENAMKIRTEYDELESSPSEEKWIANRTAPFYLFPNPNTFTPQTDISEFYELDMPSLKPKGQNRIKITEPCEMTEKGYVTYPGKLDLI
jgi:hypothetical protein